MAQALPHAPTIQSNPKFSKALSGDFTFNLECQKTRSGSFLLRNIRRLLSHHERLLRQFADPTNTYLQPALRRGECSCPEASSCQHSQQGLAPVADVSEHSRTPCSEAVSPLAKSVAGNRSVQKLPIRIMNNEFEAASRRSARKLRESFYDNDTAELTITLCSIRKLLNFTSNRPSEGEHPQKRLKMDHFKCQCSLTIWDNRPGQTISEAIVKRNVFCTLTAVDNGVYGPCVYVELEKPFSVKAGDLKVPVDRNGESGLEITDNYFMEFKIIPTRSDVDWPPIPILGKSDGDHYSRLTKLASEALAGALIMKYKEIPKAPDQSTPLKAFFLYNGRTFKTKYGLEVSAQWNRPSGTTDALDDQFGVEKAVLQVPQKDSQTGRNHSKPKDKAQASVSQKEVSLVESVKRRRRKVKVIYLFDPNTCRSQEVRKEYRTAEVNGFICPACPVFKAKSLLELRFHFLSSHHKYNFALGQVVEDEDVRELREVVFEVTPVPIPRPTSRLIKNEREFEWVAKATPFDLAAFLDGDTSWLGSIDEEAKVPVRRALPPPPASTVNLTTDPSTDRRLRGLGFLSAEEVRDFRKPIRKQHHVIKLIRQIDDKVATYNSVSHRQTFESEEPMSETDDECDDEWFIQRHLETLDIAAREEAWDPMKRELFRRWDLHRLEEKLEHTRFISDSLIRFVRKEKNWLACPHAALQAAFDQLLGEMAGSRFISAQVTADVRKMISDAKEAATDASKVDERPTAEKASESPAEGGGGLAKVAPLAENWQRSDMEQLFHAFLFLYRGRGLIPQQGLTDEQYRFFDDPAPNRAEVDAVLRKWKPEHDFESFLAAALGPSAFSTPASPFVPTPKHPTPEEELASWRKQILAQPPGHCGACSNPILRQIDEGAHCTAPTCPTSSAWFHLKCVKLKQRRANWMCRGCRVEAKLKGELENEKKDKGKGKERAVD